MINKELALEILDIANRLGSENCRVVLNSNTQSSFCVKNNVLDKIESSNSSSVFLQLYTNSRYGSFSTNILEKGRLVEFVKKAIETTEAVAPDLERGLPDPELYYKNDGEDLEQYDPSVGSLTNQQKIEIAYNCSNEIFESDDRILSVSSTFEESEEHNIVVDSQNFINQNSQSSFFLNCECSVMADDDTRPEGWWYDGSLYFESLKKEGIAKEALKRAVDRLNPQKLISGQYNIILENRVASRMISPLLSALSGAALQQNNSFLKETKGKQLFNNQLMIIDKPHLKRRFGSRYFDNEGVATKEMAIINEGVVSNYFINSYYSKKLSMPTTIDSPSQPLCFSRERGERGESKLSYHPLIADCHKGILITGFNGGNSNSATGDFSFGIQGFWFQDGVIKYPIKEMIITGNLIDFWSRFISSAHDYTTATRILTPSLAFEGITLNGI